MHNSLKLAAVLVAVTATSASAQGRGRHSDGVPPGMRPAAGMCRVWINGVPPGQQPAATDCVTAQAQVRANSRVLYGSNTSSIRNLNRTYTRRRQLADGSWVLESFRKDAAGNVTVLSSRAINRTPNGTWNDKRRGDDNEANDDRDERKGDDREMKSERKRDKREWKDDMKEGKGNKGKKDKDDHDEDDNS